MEENGWRQWKLRRAAKKHGRVDTKTGRVHKKSRSEHTKSGRSGQKMLWWLVETTTLMQRSTTLWWESTTTKQGSATSRWESTTTKQRNATLRWDIAILARTYLLPLSMFTVPTSLHASNSKSPSNNDQLHYDCNKINLATSTLLSNHTHNNLSHKWNNFHSTYYTMPYLSGQLPRREKEGRPYSIPNHLTLLRCLQGSLLFSVGGPEPFTL